MESTNPVVTTSQTSADAARPIGRVETDAFCACGYNLHTQAVVRDERLGIPICRCPECGKFHAVGKETSANSLWLSRLGCLMTGVWVLFVIALLGWAAVGLFGLQALNVELMWELRRPPSQYSARPEEVEPWVRVFWAGCVLAGFIFASMVTVLMWHVERMRYAYMFVIPLLSVVLLVYIASLDGWRELTVLKGIDFVIPTVAQVAGMGVGILFGRAVARGVLRMFLPPRVLQTLAFLWEVDGKVAPSVRVREAERGGG